MKKVIELKSCPFCGGKPKILNVVQHYMVCCTECFGMVGLFDKERSAIKVWNRRTDNGKEV